MPQPKSARTKKAPTSEPAPEPVPDGIAAALDTLHQGVVLRRERLQEVVDDAVRRGRMTRDDAEDLVQSLVASGRRQAEDLYAEVEKLVDRGRKEVGTAATQARKRTARSPVAREVDKARRRIAGGGLGGFPILAYDDLTSAQVLERLPDLGPAELRRVRDHERRGAHRKGVLAAIEKRLA
jgi:polyhydroxyalkanoate synthesis regulator phasin